MATDDYAFSFRNLRTVTAALDSSPAIAVDEIDRFLNTVLPGLQAEIVDRTPESQGHLRSSIIHRHNVSETGWLGVVGTPLNYALPVELGSKPHPVSEEGILALAEWAKRKLPLGQTVSIKTGRALKNKSLEEAALSAAHAIAWKIRAKGTQGAFMFRDAFEKNRNWVLQMFDQAVTRIARRIGDGA